MLPQEKYDRDLSELFLTEGTTEIAGYKVASPTLASFMLLELLGNSFVMVENLGQIPANMFTFTTVQALAVLRFKDTYKLVKMIADDRDAFDRLVLRMAEELPASTPVLDIAVAIVELMNNGKRSSAKESPSPKKRQAQAKGKKASSRRGGLSQPA
nr:MAG TPA: hypothetical protein [Caudoviricetes sp.]